MAEIDLFEVPKFGIERARLADFRAWYHSLAAMLEQIDSSSYYGNYVPENSEWNGKMILSRIPRRYWKYEYKHVATHWAKNIDALNKFRAYWQDFGEQAKLGNGLWLHGDYGSAKTTAATVICKACLDHYRTAFFWNSKQLYDFLNDDKYNQDKRNFVQYTTRVELLVIDDVFASIDKQSVSNDPQKEAELIEKIFIERCNNSKPTIFTANHSIKFNEDAHLINGATLSRMYGSLTEIVIHSEDLRQIKE